MLKDELARNILEYIFIKILPKYGYKIRKNQVYLALEILESLQGRKIALCEAEVGTGKTHAYIIAAIVNKLLDKNFNWIRNSSPAI